MAIIMHMQPEVPPLTWREFLKVAPERSIAVDGFVKDATKFYFKRSIANFNHHEKCDRFSTRATCEQVLNAIRMGLLDRYRNENGEIEIHFFANDCDEDVCLTYFLLKNSHLAENAVNPALNRLVKNEDLLDTTSGMYPIHKDSSILAEMAWIFEPYRRARFNGELNVKNARTFTAIIEDVCHRIMQYIIGNGQKLVLDTSYDTITTYKNWSMVKELGVNARIAMISDGIKAFVSIRERSDGKWNYVIGKRSPYINFDIEEMYKKLNEKEGSDIDLWGGSNTIGGSPRVAGSKLSPDEVANVINMIVDKLDKKRKK